MINTEKTLNDYAYESFRKALVRIAHRNHPEKDTYELDHALESLFTDWQREEDKGSVCIRWKNTDDNKAIVSTLKDFGLAVDGSKFNPAEAPKYSIELAPFIIDTAEDHYIRIYSQSSFFEESMLAAQLAAMANIKKTPSENALTVYNNIQKNYDNPKQLSAIKKSMNNQLTIICGGPGTGKTTSAVHILNCFLADKSEATIYLTAPTGKATARLLESVANGAEQTNSSYVQTALDNNQIKSNTIHKWLVTETSQGRRPTVKTPLECDLLVIDEASMIDSSLAFRLFSVIDPDKTKVVILGDMYQLAAVGPGAVYADISDTNGALKDHVVELTKTFRFKGLIGKLAKAINEQNKTDSQHYQDTIKELSETTILTKEQAKQLEEMKKEKQDLDRQRFDKVQEIFKEARDTGNPVVSFDNTPTKYRESLTKSAQAWLKTHLQKYCDSVEGLVKNTSVEDLTSVWKVLSGFRAIAAQRQGNMSVTAINDYCDDFIKSNYAKKLGIQPEDRLYIGKVIIVRKNDPALELSNGDVGFIYKDKKGAWQTYFGDLHKSQPAQLLPNYDTAFAITIHQSQGSGFDDVAVFLPSNTSSEDKQSVGLATRELLYTAVTRTQKTCAIFGTDEALKQSLDNRTRRTGGLRLRLDKYVLQ